MTIDEFRGSMGGVSAPRGLSAALVALWHDARGDWNQAHETAQDIDGPVGAWVHAYLHRKEGDTANAGYWYRRANKPAATGALDDEWAAIAADLLARER